MLGKPQLGMLVKIAAPIGHRCNQFGLYNFCFDHICFGHIYVGENRLFCLLRLTLDLCLFVFGNRAAFPRGGQAHPAAVMFFYATVWSAKSISPFPLKPDQGKSTG
jgi:hypothetical protein